MAQRIKNKISYEKTMNHYRFKFEGLEEPVFYYDLYPTAKKNYYTNNDMRYNFGQGLKYKPNIHSNNCYEATQCYQNYSKYQNILREFITTFSNDNLDMKIGIVTIPSSKQETLTCVTQVVRNVI